MGEFAPCPPEALTAAEAVCGPVSLTEVTHRRGAAVWKAAGALATVAIKAGYGEGEEITAQEGAVLAALPGYSAVSGRFEGGTWYVTPWLHGKSTWATFATARDGQSSGRAAAIEAAIDLCRAVAELHAYSWVHSDLQPAHGIHTDSGVRLLDFAWACHPGFAQSPLFKGGIVHLLAPELAASIRSGSRPAKPSAASDVYALAGTLWTCATGRWPLDYAAAGLDRRAAGPDGIRDAVATGTIPLDADFPWTELRNLLRPVLLATAECRPTAAELAIALGAL